MNKFVLVILLCFSFGVAFSYAEETKTSNVEYDGLIKKNQPGVVSVKTNSSSYWFAGFLIPCGGNLIPPVPFVGGFFGWRGNEWVYKFEPSAYGLVYAYTYVPSTALPFTISYILFEKQTCFSLGAGISFGSQCEGGYSGVIPLIEADFTYPSNSSTQFELNGKYFWMNGNNLGEGMEGFWITAGMRFKLWEKSCIHWGD